MPNPLLNSLMQQNSVPNSNMGQLRQVYQMINSSKNPRAVIQQLAQTNPQLQPMLQIMNSGGNYEQIFRNMAQQRGINPDEFVKQIKG